MMKSGFRLLYVSTIKCWLVLENAVRKLDLVYRYMAQPIVGLLVYSFGHISVHYLLYIFFIGQFFVQYFIVVANLRHCLHYHIIYYLTRYLCALFFKLIQKYLFAHFFS